MSTIIIDRSLAEAVQQTLMAKIPQLGSIHVDETGPRTVHLSGTVNSFYLRQLAFSIARHVAGVGHVSDGIRVVYPDRPRPQADATIRSHRRRARVHDGHSDDVRS
jgi:osmotically-inducible protein OsmY